MDQSSTPTQTPDSSEEEASARRISVTTIVGIAILLAVGLVTIGLLAYNAKDESAATDTAQNEVITLDSTSPADEAAVDDASTDIDKNIQDLDNSSDFKDSDLSESNLGL